MFQDSLTKKIAEAAAQIKTEPEIIKVNEKSVEGAVEKIMDEELKGNQHKIDANKNGKVDAHDFKLLQAQKEKEKANSMKHGKEVKEEIEELDELSKDTLKSYAGKVVDKTRTMPQGAKKQKHLAGYGSAMDKMDKKMKEEVELDEAEKKLFPGTPEYKAKFGTDREKHEAKYGKSDVKKLAPYGYRDKSEYEKAKEMKEEKSFSAMLESYKEGGLKYIASLVKEEPDNEEFTKEVADQKAKMDGKKKGGDVAKASVQAVKVEETEIAVINADIANGVEMVDIEERSLTEPEMKKKEEIVKSMKKNMKGFKERYGERAKEVIYATATARAKGE